MLVSKFYNYDVFNTLEGYRFATMSICITAYFYKISNGVQ